jgi:hypothetical protein
VADKRANEHDLFEVINGAFENASDSVQIHEKEETPPAQRSEKGIAPA